MSAKVAAEACRYAADGLLEVFPVCPFDGYAEHFGEPVAAKLPLVSQYRATRDVAQIDEWWRRWPDALIGCRLAPEVIVLDVDPRHGGDKTWEALEQEYGPIVANRRHYSGRGDGGHHSWFLRPEQPMSIRGLNVWAEARQVGEMIVTKNGTTRWVCGIDLLHHDHRYSILPPSKHPDTGDPYRWGGGTGTTLGPLPADLAKILTEPVQRVNGERTSNRSTGYTGDSPADWFSTTRTWVEVLGPHGWTCVRGDGDSDGSLWRHPAATSGHGHSASIRHDCLFVHSTSTVFTDTEAGSPHGYTRFAAWALLEHGDDQKCAARAARHLRDGPRGEPPHTDAPPRTDAPPCPPTTMRTTLDAEFWNRRKLFRHVRDAAQASMTSPAALLNNVLARASALVHPSIRLPDVVGGFGTLDFIAAVIAETSVGKSSATVVGQRLLPAPAPPSGGEPSPWMMDMPIGSGEGISQAFMVPELAPDTAGAMKPTGRQVVGRQALHFSIDEGKAFTQQADRAGTTVAATLATCWSGGGYGNLNADPTKRRIIEGGRTRVSAVINMQASNAHLLWTPDLESIGFTGRMSFSSAHDPDAPEIADQPEWPGPLDWTPPAGVAGGGMIVITYAPEIVTEIKTTRLGVLRGTEVVDRRQSQHLLMRCKIAALLGILDDRLDVNLEDWDLAAQILANSAAVLEQLDQLRKIQVAQVDDAIGRRRARIAAVEHDETEEKAIAKLARALPSKVPDEGISRADLRKKATASTTRHRFDDALERAVHGGYLTVTDGRIHRVAR